MTQLKPIVLCADDFGLNAGISEGILSLVRKQRLSAVSCMVNSPGFDEYAQKLMSLNKQVQIGLHFNLTQGKLLSGGNCFGLNELLLRTHLRFLDASVLIQEFQAQLDAFIHTMGCLPHFIDGHQHVHQFPVIRQVILAHYEQHLKTQDIAIRSTYPALSLKKYAFKTKVLAWTGGRALQAKLNQLGITHNSCFAGVYDFAQNVDYRALFRQWLAKSLPNALIMCHPGQHSDDLDVIAKTRVLELNYLMSDEFLEDCQEHRICLHTGLDVKVLKRIVSGSKLG